MRNAVIINDVAPLHISHTRTHTISNVNTYTLKTNREIQDVGTFLFYNVHKSTD